MPFAYDVPPNSGALTQGEILADIWVHHVVHPPISIPEGLDPEIHSKLYPLVLVMTAVCDLYQDFAARFPDDEARQLYSPRIADESDPALISHVLLCEVYRRNEFRVPMKGSEPWRRIEQNQNERYHHLQGASVGDTCESELPDLYLDFKKTLGLAPQDLYEGLGRGQLARVAVVPPIYLHDLMHRFYGFLSRVGLPE